MHYVKTIDEALMVSLPTVADSPAKILSPTPPASPQVEQNDRVLTTRA